MSSSVRPSVGLSSVTFVHRTQAIEIFGLVSTPFGTLEREFTFANKRTEPPLAIARSKIRLDGLPTRLKEDANQYWLFERKTS